MEERKNTLKRQTAQKICVSQLLSGRYVKEDGLEPNYLLVDNTKIFRINLMGVVINKESDEFVLEDWTGRIDARCFSEKSRFDFKLGDVVLVIGKLREYSGERCVVPETVNVIDNKLWIDVRRIELSRNKKEEIAVEEGVEVNNPEQKVVEFIKGNDVRDGVDINYVVDNIDEKDAEQIIKNLIKEGVIFEIKPGRLKILK